MLTADQINEKWAPIIESEDAPSIKDTYKKTVIARLLENQEIEGAKQLSEASVNVAPVSGGSIGTFDPVLISMVRRAVPVSIGFDIWGVQPMTGPTGLIFAMKSKYSTPGGTEALFNEANTKFSGAATAVGSGTPDSTLTDPFNANYGTGIGMTTATGEAGSFGEMAFEVVKKSVEAKTRGLKATWTNELQQDLQAIHGLSADAELANILSTEITAEMDREMMRRAYIMAPLGAAACTTPGTFDLDVDSNGRWSVERFKGLMYQIERDANTIAVATRRGKGNFVVCSADVASSLAMTGLLEANPTSVIPGWVDPSSSSYVGILNGKVKVFVDPFITSQGYCIGYKGASSFDAAGFYCPYVPLTKYQTVDPTSLQPITALKTRYGFQINPYDAVANDGVEVGNSSYLRKVKVINLA